MTTPNDKLELIFEKWRIGLKNKDKTYSKVQGNFEELFDELEGAGISFEDARELLPRAIKAHEPNDSTIRWIYNFKRKSHAKTATQTESEYKAGWLKDIDDFARAAFHNVYPTNFTIDPSTDSMLKNANIKLTSREHRQQRDYAESFPILDTEKFERELAASGSITYDPTINFKTSDEEGTDGNLQ